MTHRWPRQTPAALPSSGSTGRRLWGRGRGSRDILCHPGRQCSRPRCRCRRGSCGQKHCGGSDGQWIGGTEGGHVTLNPDPFNSHIPSPQYMHLALGCIRPPHTHAVLLSVRPVLGTTVHRGSVVKGTPSTKVTGSSGAAVHSSSRGLGGCEYRTKPWTNFRLHREEGVWAGHAKRDIQGAQEG